MEFSDYIIYVDESGDHGLINIDDSYPIFCLAFCIIKKEEYINKVCPDLQSLKFKYWGHDFVNLHASDIRKQRGDFSFLRHAPAIRDNFFNDLNTIISNTPMHIITSVIKKDDLNKRYSNPFNPYEISLLFCMEKILKFLICNGQKDKTIHIIFESRGTKEDKELELEFRRICDNQRSWGWKKSNFKEINFEAFFVSKNSNLPGLQISDLVARPIGLNTLRPSQPNQSWEIIKDKIYNKKVFP